MRSIVDWVRSMYGSHFIFFQAPVEVRSDLGEDDDKLIDAHSTVPHIWVPNKMGHSLRELPMC